MRLQGGFDGFSAAHLREGEQESEGRLGALILVHPVNMQAVPAAATLGIIERQTEIVAALEPFECLVCMGKPITISRGLMSLETGANHGVGLDRLLVE